MYQVASLHSGAVYNVYKVTLAITMMIIPVLHMMSQNSSALNATLLLEASKKSFCSKQKSHYLSVNHKLSCHTCRCMQSSERTV